MKKTWGKLAPRTKRRYQAQGVTARKYNTAVKRGLRGDARAAFLGVERGKISGIAARNPFNVVRDAILQRRPDGTATMPDGRGKGVARRDAGAIKWDKVRARVEKQTADMQKHIGKARRLASYEAHADYFMEHEDFDSDLNPLWYND